MIAAFFNDFLELFFQAMLTEELRLPWSNVTTKVKLFFFPFIFLLYKLCLITSSLWASSQGCVRRIDCHVVKTLTCCVQRHYNFKNYWDCKVTTMPTAITKTAFVCSRRKSLNSTWTFKKKKFFFLEKYVYCSVKLCVQKTHFIGFPHETYI